MHRGVLELALQIVSDKQPLDAYRDVLAPETFEHPSNVVSALGGA